MPENKPHIPADLEMSRRRMAQQIADQVGRLADTVKNKPLVERCRAAKLYLSEAKQYLGAQGLDETSHWMAITGRVFIDTALEILDSIEERT